MINIDRQLISTKLHKKLSKIIFFYLRKLSQFRGKFSSTALVIDTFDVKYCVKHSTRKLTSKLR